MVDEHDIGLGLTIRASVDIDTSPKDVGPHVSVVAELFEGRYVCTEIVIREKREVGLTGTTLRDIAVGFYVEFAAEASNSGVEERLSDLAREVMEASTRVTDDLLRTVATTYRWGYAVSGNPTAKIMQIFEIERPRAAAWVARARERGFLGTTEMGRPGGVVS